MGNMEARLAEFNILTEKVISYEARLSKMSITIQNYDKERETNEVIKRDNEVLKRKITELGDAVNKLNESEYKIELISREVERLNNIVENKNK